MIKTIKNMRDLREANPGWFTESNKSFFNDVDYWLVIDNEGQPYLIRSTYAWTDMFDGKKKLHYRVNEIEESGKIGSLVDNVFKSYDEAEEWIKE